MHPRKTDWLRKPQRDPKVLEIPLELPKPQKAGELTVDHFVFRKPDRILTNAMRMFPFGFGFGEPEPPWNEITVFGAKQTVEEGFFITRILKDDTLWMSDSPQERYMMEFAARQARGNVLVGGCGLGMFPQYCLHHNNVSSLTIVEIDPQVIALTQELQWAKDPRITIVKGDISCEIQRMIDEKRRFDTVYLDTHEQMTPDYLPYLNALREMGRKVLTEARNKGAGHVYVWGHKKTVEQARKDARKSLEQVDAYGFRDREQRADFDKKFPIEALLLKEIESRGYRPKIGSYSKTIQKRSGWSSTALTSKELDAFFWGLRVKSAELPLRQKDNELTRAA